MNAPAPPPPPSSPAPRASTPPQGGYSPAPLVVISTLILDLAALVLIALLAHWHTFAPEATAGAFFAVISGQIASKSRSGARGIGGLPGAGIVIGLLAAAHAMFYRHGGGA